MKVIIVECCNGYTMARVFVDEEFLHLLVQSLKIFSYRYQKLRNVGNNLK